MRNWKRLVKSSSSPLFTIHLVYKFKLPTPFNSFLEIEFLKIRKEKYLTSERIIQRARFLCPGKTNEISRRFVEISREKKKTALFDSIGTIARGRSKRKEDQVVNHCMWATLPQVGQAIPLNRPNYPPSGKLRHPRTLVETRARSGQVASAT